MKYPKIAILCLTYNHSRYITETIESFKNQDYKECDFFILDDCSTDDTYSLAVAASVGDERVKIIRNKKNIGAALNSKKAISLVLNDYEYIGFCEGDDYLINKERLSKQVSFLEKNKSCSLVFTAANIIDETGDFIRIDTWGRDVRYFTAKQAIFIGGNLCATASTLYRSNVIKDINDDFFNYPVGDYPLQILASFQGEIAYLPIIGASYRQQSLSSWTRQMLDVNKYIDNHENTIRMFDELNKASSYENNWIFKVSKLKYWYFFSVNSRIPFNKRIKYVFLKGRVFRFMVIVVLLYPFFNFFNFLRRQIRFKMMRYVK